MDKEDFLRLQEQERRELENAWLNSAVDQREFNLMRRELRKLPTHPDLATGSNDRGGLLPRSQGGSGRTRQADKVNG